MDRLRLLAFFPFVIVLLVGVVPAHDVASQEAGNGAITGQLLIKGGGPLSGGTVFLFNDAAGPPPSQEKYWRIPDYIEPIDDAGRFTVELPAGKYYLGAIKRTAGDKIGPPREGDYFYIDRDEKGSPKAYTVGKGQKIDIGVISEAAPFSRTVVKLKDGITAIEGAVLDTAGKPIEGALVYAFLSPSMVGKPLFVSDRTGKDGKYFLRVHEGGKYYLKVRDLYGGGPPDKGSIIGSYGEESLVAVTVKRGDITKGIDIKVIRFPGRGREKE